MLQRIFEDQILIYVMLGLCGFGIFVKGIISIAYWRLIRASDQMGSSRNKLMKLMRLKFETCYKLKIGVNNVDVFVDKYVYKHKFCGILLYTWENIGGQLLLLCMLTGTMGAVLGLIYECGRTAILSTLFTGVFTATLLIIFENLLNLSTKKRVLRVNITDYLENFLKVKMEKEHLTPELLQAYRNEYFATDGDDTKKADVTENKKDREEYSTKEEAKIQEVVESLTAAVAEKVMEGKPKKQTKRNTKIYQLNKKEERIIEDILKEYLA